MPARLRAAIEYDAGSLGLARDLEVRLGPTFTASQRRPELPEEAPTDAYVVWNASAAASFPLTGGASLRASLAIDNIADTRYVDPMSRFRPYGVPAEGRSVRLRLGVSW